MGTLTFTHTVDGTEPIGGAIVFGQVPPFTGHFSVSVSLDVGVTQIANLTASLARFSDATTCYSQGISLIPPSSGSGFQTDVGNPGFAWHCNDWDHLVIGYSNDTFRLPQGALMTVQITADTLGGTPCIYGTQMKPGMPVVQALDNALVAAAFALLPGGYWQQVLYGYLGLMVDVQVLCSGPPRPLTILNPRILINPGSAALEVVLSTLWPYFCECVSGDPAPTPPPLPNPPKDPGWPADPTYPVNPTDPCLDLTEVRRKLDQILRVTQNDLELDRTVQRYTAPFATVDGPSFLGLSGSGTVQIERAVGLRVTLHESETALVIPSSPNYIWDQGWMSISDGGALLIQRRVARDIVHWFPSHCWLATAFGYFLKPGVTLDVVALLAEP